MTCLTHINNKLIQSIISNFWSILILMEKNSYKIFGVFSILGRIRIRIKGRGRSKIRIRIKGRGQSRIQIFIKLMRIHIISSMSSIIFKTAHCFFKLQLGEYIWRKKKKKYMKFVINPFGHGGFSDPYLKVHCEGVKLKKKIHRGICNKKFCKVTNFQVWVA